jgi:hypothetical protein
MSHEERESQPTLHHRLAAEDMLWDYFGTFEIESPERAVPCSALYPKNRLSYLVDVIGFCASGRNNDRECWLPGESLARLFRYHGVPAEFVPDATEPVSPRTAHLGRLRVDAKALWDAYQNPSWHRFEFRTFQCNIKSLWDQKCAIRDKGDPDKIVYFGTVSAKAPTVAHGPRRSGA